MHERLCEQLYELGSKPGIIAARIGCDVQLVIAWLRGTSLPGARYLKRLYDLGCDIIYILEDDD